MSTTPPAPAPGSVSLAHAVISLLEGRYREWLSPEEYRACRAEIAEIIDSDTAAYRVIEEMKDAAFNPICRNGKTQDETLGEIRSLRKYYDRMTNLEGPYWVALAALDIAEKALEAIKERGQSAFDRTREMGGIAASALSSCRAARGKAGAT